MKNLLFIFSFLGINLSLFTQQLETFEGIFPTTLSTIGDAKYSYYTDPKTNKKIKQGNFIYKLRLVKGFSKLDQDIKGIYKNGLKEGVWVFKTTLRDYNESGEEYNTGTILLNANYSQGIPYGKWIVTISKKSRKVLSVDNGQTKWSKFAPSIYKQISFSIFDGCFVDSLIITTENYKLIGRLNTSGFFDGEWLSEIPNKEQQIEWYDNGFLLKSERKRIPDYDLIDTINNYIVFENRVQFINKIKDSLPATLGNLSFKLDTTSLIANNKNKIIQILNENVFLNPYFLFKDIDGDKVDLSDLKGLYKVSVTNNITNEEKMKLNQITDYSTKIQQINIDINKYIQGKTLFDEVENVIKLINYYKKVGDKYKCYTDQLMIVEDISQGKLLVSKYCKSTVVLTEPIPDFKTRKEILDFFVTDLKQKYQKAEEHKKQIKEKLLPE